MFWMLLALGIYLLLITPVTLWADIRLEERLTGVVEARVWGVPVFRRSQPTPGKQVATTGGPSDERNAKASSAKASAGKRLLRRMGQALWKNKKVRNSLLRQIEVETLEVLLCVGLTGADKTALTTGALRTAYQLLPLRWRRHTRFQVLPDFFRQRTSFHGRCMIFLRLGTLIITAARLAPQAAARTCAPGAKEA